MSPEQAAGRADRVDARSDVYSLDATPFCLLTGRPPFQDRDLGTLLARVRRGEFPRPREVNGSIPLALEAVYLQAMAPAAQARYPSARALADAVEEPLASGPVSSRRSGRSPPRPKSPGSASSTTLCSGRRGPGIEYAHRDAISPGEMDGVLRRALAAGHLDVVFGDCFLVNEEAAAELR